MMTNYIICYIIDLAQKQFTVKSHKESVRFTKIHFDSFWPLISHTKTEKNPTTFQDFDQEVPSALSHSQILLVRKNLATIINQSGFGILVT